MSARDLRRMMTLLALVAAGAACGKPGRALIPVDVTAQAPLAAQLRAVRLVAVAGEGGADHELIEQSFEWSGTEQHLGLYIPRWISGTVTVHAVGSCVENGDCAISEAKPAEVRAGEASEALRLELRPAPSQDGGLDEKTATDGAAADAERDAEHETPLDDAGPLTEDARSGADSDSRLDGAMAVDARADQADVGLDVPSVPDSTISDDAGIADLRSPHDAQLDVAIDAGSGDVAPRVWGPAVLLPSDPDFLEYNDNQPEVTMDSAGNALALWFSSQRVWSGRYSPAEGWTPAGLVEPLGENRWQRVALDDTGEGWGAWVQTAVASDGHNWAQPGVWIRHFSNNSWETTRTWLADNACVGLQMATNGHGNLAAVYLLEGTPRQLWAIYLDRELGWTENQLLSVAGGQSVFGTAYMSAAKDGFTVAMDGSGHAVAAWCQATDGQANHSYIWVSEGSFSGWSNASQVSAPLSECTTPAVVLNATGQGVLAWRASDNTIRARTFEKSPGDVAPVLGEERTVAETTGAEVFAPTAVVDNGGDLTVLWPVSDGASPPRVLVRASRSTLTAGTRQPWSAPSWIETGAEPGYVTAFDELWHSLRAGADAAGNVIVTWSKRTSSNPPSVCPAILANRYDVQSNDWDHAATVLASELSCRGKWASQPRSAVSADGSAVVTFRYGDDEKMHVWAVHYR